MYGDSYIFSAAIGILKYLEPHLLQQDEMTVGKLLKNIVACRMQFEQDQTYPIEAYERPALWRECEFIVKSCRVFSFAKFMWAARPTTDLLMSISLWEADFAAAAFEPMLPIC